MRRPSTVSGAALCIPTNGAAASTRHNWLIFDIAGMRKYTIKIRVEKEAEEVSCPYGNPSDRAGTRRRGAFAQAHRSQDATQEAQAQAAARRRDRIMVS